MKSLSDLSIENNNVSQHPVNQVDTQCDKMNLDEIMDLLEKDREKDQLEEEMEKQELRQQRVNDSLLNLELPDQVCNKMERNEDVKFNIKTTYEEDSIDEYMEEILKLPQLKSNI